MHLLERKLSIAMGVLLIGTTGPMLAAQGATDVPASTGFFYNEKLDVKGDATGSFSANETHLTGQITLADRVFDLSLDRFDTLNVSNLDYPSYRGNSTSGGESYRTTAWWNNRTKVFQANIAMNFTGYTAYLSPNATRAEDLRLAFMENRTALQNVTEFVDPGDVLVDETVSTLNGTVNESLELKRAHEDNDLTALQILEEDSQSTSDQFQGSFHSGSGPANSDTRFPGRLDLSLTSELRHTDFPATFDEIQESNGDTWVSALAWVSDFSREAEQGSLGHQEVQWGTAHVALESEDSNVDKNPIRFVDGRTVPEQDQESASWSIDIGIGYGMVGVGTSADINDGCTGGNPYTERRGADVDWSRRKVAVHVDFCENEPIDTNYGDDLPDTEDKALGAQILVDTLDGEEDFYPIDVESRMDYYRSESCEWTEPSFWSTTCIQEKYTSHAMHLGTDAWFQVDRWGDDKRVSKNYDFNLGDRKVAEEMFETSTDLIPSGQINTFWCLSTLRNQDDGGFWNWWEFEGPISEGHEVQIFLFRSFQDSDGEWFRENRGLFEGSIQDPGLQPWPEYDIALGIPVPSDAKEDNWVGHWKSLFRIQDTTDVWREVNAMEWTIGGC